MVKLTTVIHSDEQGKDYSHVYELKEIRFNYSSGTMEFVGIDDKGEECNFYIRLLLTNGE